MVAGYEFWWLAGVCALATYATRVGGHIVLSRFGTIHHRAAAALDAVPAAVLTALVVPALVTRGWAETIALIAAFLIAMRLPPIATVVIGLALLVALRNLL